MDREKRQTLNIPEAAKVLGISRGSAYGLAAQGKLPVIHLGLKRMVVPIVALERMLAEAGTDKGESEERQ
ncbi:MAG: helix-turn-helix domain-containing protein [Nitrospirae bacterium]|nr:helix-turn-helix domain-containing protein [Nitrospirota bacterium]